MRHSADVGKPVVAAGIWPVGVLFVSLAITALFWWSIDRYVARTEAQRFERYSERVRTAIVERTDDLHRLLLASRGLFDASASVGHHEWSAFARSIDYRYYHGMMGVGFIERVPRTELAAFVRKVEKDAGLPFKFRQLNPTPQYPDVYPIRFIEPLSTNGPARGLDIGSERNRREAAEAAMLTGQVTLTKRLTLVQDKQKIAGFLIYAPVFRSKHIPATEAERRRDLLGWTYMPLRISELMDGVGKQVESMIDFEVFEGKANERRSLLYDADGHFEQTQDAALSQRHFARRTFHVAHTVSLYGQTWTIYTSTRPEFDATANTGLPKVVAFGGILVSLLATLAVWSLSRTRARALVLADQMTAESQTNERKLRDSEQRLSAILSGAMDPIITIHADGRLEHFNPAAEKVFGYARDEVVGRNVNMLMPEPFHSAHDAYLERYLASGERHIIGAVREVEGRRKDGELFPMELSISEIKVHGETMFTGIVRDITERKKVERMKSEFVSTVSHELRTPLTSIRGSLGLIVGGAMGEMPAQAKSLAEIAYSNAERLVRLINDILDIEKIESGKVTFNPALQPLRALLEQAISVNQGYAQQHQVSLELTRQDMDVTVNVDADRFMQVMSNLLSNAIKYSPRGGVVSVRVTAQLGRVLIQVVDQGTGIPAEFKGRIFTKFSQADSSDTRAKGGTGLGLSIAKALVERMGGTIDYESVSGQGTTFYFDLPVFGQRQLAEAGAAATAVGGDAHGELGRVLYVEDDPDLRHVLQTVARDDAVFEFAENLGQAREMLGTRHYDLVLLDIALPDGLGWELLPVVNSLPQPPLVLVFSAQDVGNAHAQEIAATLVKSQTSNEALLSTIRSLIDRQKAA